MEFTPRYLPNCVSYVLASFDIQQDEEYVDPSDVDLYKYFEEVGKKDNADIVVAWHNHPEEGRVLEHVAVFDWNDKGFIHHRRGHGRGVATDTLETLERKFPSPEFDICCMKLKIEHLPIRLYMNAMMYENH